MKRIILFLIILFPFFTTAQIYVDQDASGNQTGTSWNHAYRNLETAIDAAVTGDQIWVAEGTYFPFNFKSEELDYFNWRYTYQLDKDVEIYGGFSGSETFLEARNPMDHPTILTGKISYEEETYQISTVVTFSGVTNAAVLDGFTIQEGNANRASANIGGGILVTALSSGISASPIIRNCIIQNNEAFSGAGMACVSSHGGMVSPVVVSCKFFDNIATEKGGGLLSQANGGNTTLVFENTIFSNNRGQQGGAICLNDQNANLSAYFTGCNFEANRATKGGAVYNEVDGLLSLEPVFTDCKFMSNHADQGYGGAFYNYSKKGFFNLSINNTRFSGNTATNYGGAMANVTTGGTATPIISGCKFDNNSANQGGALYNYASGGSTNPKISSTTFFANTSRIEGGSIMNFAYFLDLKVEITNCTFANNESINDLGSIYNRGDGYANLEVGMINSILWDKGIGISNEAPLTLKLGNNIIKGEQLPSDGTDLGNNYLNYDPQFVDLQNGDLRLIACSPAVDNGRELSFTSVTQDSEGNTRKIGSLDIGALENQVKRSLLDDPNTLFTADHEYTDPQGWTHYYDCGQNVLLLSLKKNGQEIGQLGDGAFRVEILTTPAYRTGLGTEITSAAYVTSTSCFAMNRYWNVKATRQPNATVGVRFYFSDQDIKEMINSSNYISSIEDAYFFKLNNNNNPRATEVEASDYQEYVFDPQTASEETWTKGFFQGFQYAEYFVNGFSGGGATTGANVGALPVEMVAFKGVEKNQGVQLSWSTETEFNSLGFEIQHRTDGEDWEILGFKNSHGNSTTLKNYEYKHQKALPGVHYYKLRAVDLDATYEDSKIISVNVSNEHFSTLIYPNPIRNTNVIRYNRAGGSLDLVVVYNVQGQEIYRQNNLDDVADDIVLPQVLGVGVYNVVFYSGQQSEIQPLIVQE